MVRRTDALDERQPIQRSACSTVIGQLAVRDRRDVAGIAERTVAKLY
jgi:hypothetical protein